MSCDCPICYEVIGDNNTTTTSCGHKFHTSCLIRSIMSVNKLCPCCRNLLAETPAVVPELVVPQYIQHRVMTPHELENVCLGNELRYMDFINKFFKLNKSASIREKANIYIPLEEFENMYSDAIKRHVRYYRVSVDNDEGTINRVAENILFIVESTMTQKWNDAKKASMKSQREHRKRTMEGIKI